MYEAQQEHRVNELSGYHSRVQCSGRGSVHSRGGGTALAACCFEFIHTILTLHKNKKQSKIKGKFFKMRLKIIYVNCEVTYLHIR